MNKVAKIIFAIASLSFLNNSLTAKPITWQKIYGDPQVIEWGRAIVQLPDEGYIAVCEQYIFNPMLIMRLDKYGAVLWQKIYPLGRATGIAKMDDGNYLIAGSSLVKININGDTLWTRPGVNGAQLMLSKDGGFYLCGAKFVTSNITKPYLGKYNSLGYPEWEMLYNENIFDGGFSDMLIDDDGNLILIGVYSEFAIITSNPFIMKLYPGGSPIWFHGYNSLNNFYIDQIQKKNNGEFIVAGSNTLNCYFMHFNSDGLLERINYIDSNVNLVGTYSMVKTFDSGLALTGIYRQGLDTYVRLLKTDLEGNELWRKFYGSGYSNVGYYVRQTSDSGFVIIGKTEYDFKFDIFVIKTDKEGYADPPVSINTGSVVIPKEFILYQNYPNPFNPETKIEFEINMKSIINLTIYNTLGQQISQILSEEVLPGKYSVKFNPEQSNISIPSGIYFYTLMSENSIKTKKMIYIK